ncbi:MAG: hypothetical protein AAF800_00325 [Planctomycetota bacterium]
MTRPRPAAFSLIELVLTTLIVGLLAAVAVPRYAQASANVRLDAAARRVATDLKHAADLARTRSGPVVIGFNQITDQVSIFYVDPGPTTVTASLTELGGPPYRVSIVSADFNGVGLLGFDGFGQPEFGGTVTLRAGGRELMLNVDAATGEVVSP